MATTVLLLDNKPPQLLVLLLILFLTAVGQRERLPAHSPSQAQGTWASILLQVGSGQSELCSRPPKTASQTLPWRSRDERTFKRQRQHVCRHPLIAEGVGNKMRNKTSN